MKVAVVTGGTRGIGRAISKKLAQEGYRVYAIFARNRESAQSLETEARNQGLDVRCLRGDMSDEGLLKDMVETIRRDVDHVDVVVHAAASGVHKEAMNLTQRHIEWTFNVNVFSIHNLLRELVPVMPSGSRIIGITSAGGEKVIPYYAAVGSSKGALNSLFRHYAYEYAPKGIAVNLVCPGMVETDALQAFPEKEERVSASKDRTPTGRLTVPEDVAALVSFLCSEGASQIVGQTIVMDGGKGLLS